MKKFSGAVLAVLVVGVMIASSASASVLPAKFSSSAVKLTTSGVTLRKNDLEPKVCTLSPPIELFASGSSFLGGNSSFGTRFSCPNGTSLEMRWAGSVSFDTVTSQYSLKLSSGESSMLSPFGEYWQEESTATWVNGSGSTPSKITFNNAKIGHTSVGGNKVSLEGTFTATTPTGGLVTLSH